MSTKNATNQKKLSRITKMGWAFPDDTINAETDIKANNWHTISAMWYELEADGDFLKRDASSFGSNFYYTSANAQIVRDNCAVALINVSSGNDVAVNALTASASKRSLLIAEMISFCQTNNFDGVDLDLETFQVASMSAAQWIDFKTLLQELGDALHAKGLMLSMEVPPVWNTAPNNESGSGDAWDSADSEAYYRLRYSELNTLPVDQVVIMAYDYQYDYSAGEPNQPLAWLKEILNYARSQLNEDRIKIVAGLPAAGYSGTTGGYTIAGRTYDYLVAQTGFSGATRDASSGEIIWADGGTSYALCDDTSIALKIAQTEAVGVFAVALWAIGDNRYYNAYSGNSYLENKKLNVTTRTPMYAIIDSDFTLTAGTGVQSAFPAGYDVWTLEGSTTYEFEGKYFMTLGTTSRTTALAFALGGGASVTSIRYEAMSWAGQANATLTAQSSVWVDRVASTVVQAATTNTGTFIKFHGIIRMNAGGTVTPQINFSANPTGTNLMKANSYIKFTPIGLGNVTTIGSVS